MLNEYQPSSIDGANVVGDTIRGIGGHEGSDDIPCAVCECEECDGGKCIWEFEPVRDVGDAWCEVFFDDGGDVPEDECDDEDGERGHDPPFSGEGAVTDLEEVDECELLDSRVGEVCT